MSDRTIKDVGTEIEKLRSEMRDARKRYRGRDLENRLKPRNDKINQLEVELKGLEAKVKESSLSGTPEEKDAVRAKDKADRIRQIGIEIENHRKDIKKINNTNYADPKRKRTLLNARNAQITKLEEELKTLNPVSELTKEQKDARIQEIYKEINNHRNDIKKIRKQYFANPNTKKTRLNGKNAQIKKLEEELRTLQSPTPAVVGGGGTGVGSQGVKDCEKCPPAATSIIQAKVQSYKLTNSLYRINRINCDTYPTHDKCKINDMDCEVCKNFAYRDWYEQNNAKKISILGNYDDSKTEYNRTWVQTCNLGIGIFLLSIGIYYQQS